MQHCALNCTNKPFIWSHSCHSCKNIDQSKVHSHYAGCPLPMSLSYSLLTQCSAYCLSILLGTWQSSKRMPLIWASIIRLSTAVIILLGQVILPAGCILVVQKPDELWQAACFEQPLLHWRVVLNASRCYLCCPPTQRGMAIFEEIHQGLQSTDRRQICGREAHRIEHLSPKLGLKSLR